MIRLAIRCQPDLAELVLAELTAISPGGVEEEEGDGYVEYAVYGPPGELPEIPDLEALAGEALVSISSTEIPDDWADRWQDFHEPLLVAGRLWVRPSWSKPRAGTVDLVIDPGRAFGTGSHATTRMCLELLAGADEAGEAKGPLADLGTGSGVLAIAAAKLGWAPVAGCDHEQAALDAAARNAAANGVELELRRINLRVESPPAVPTLVANLTAPLLVEVASRLPAQVENLVCSGLLASEVEPVTGALSGAGLEPEERRLSGEWAALSVRRRRPRPCPPAALP